MHETPRQLEKAPEGWAHSPRRLRGGQPPPDLAKRLECGAFTAAVVRTMRQRTEEEPCSLHSGAEATALQTLARLPMALERAERLGLRRPPAAYARARRSRTHESPRPHEQRQG